MLSAGPIDNSHNKIIELMEEIGHQKVIVQV